MQSLAERTMQCRDPVIHLRAKVRTVTGKTKHLLGTQTDHASLRITELPDPVAVRLVEQDGAFFLFRLDENGEYISDSWHATVDEAKAQANFEYDIEEVDWTETEISH
jgi:hypothetical protein